MSQPLLAEAIKLIDSQNAEDPEKIIYKGAEHKKEELHAELMTQWVKELDPAATEAQILAARASHLRRWELKRSDYPEGRGGYLKWRKEQASRHAKLVENILEQVGYEKNTIERVCEIIQKKNLKNDAQVQTHEDALCLVFLETQQKSLKERLISQTGSQEEADLKLDEILEKTFKKMSPEALKRAEKYLDVGC